MRDLAYYQKGIVALIMAVLIILEDWFGWATGGITEEWIITILSVLTPILVYFVPNRSPS